MFSNGILYGFVVSFARCLDERPIDIHMIVWKVKG